MLDRVGGPETLPELLGESDFIVLAAPLTPETEDMIDAVLCAFIAAHWWHWTTGRNTVYGSQGEGYIIVPHAPVGLQPFSRPASQPASD